MRWLCWRMSVRESTTEIVGEIMKKTQVIGWQIGVSCSVRCWDNYEPAGGTKHCHIWPIEVSLSNVLSFTSTRGSAVQCGLTSLLSTKNRKPPCGKLVCMDSVVCVPLTNAKQLSLMRPEMDPIIIGSSLLIHICFNMIESYGEEGVNSLLPTLKT